MQQFSSFIILTFIYSSTCFGRSPSYHQELNDYSSSLWFYLRIVVISWSGRPARPRTQHGYHHDTKVKPEAATAVIELLMIGGRTPETCWAVNERQDNKTGKLLHLVGDLFEPIRIFSIFYLYFNTCLRKYVQSGYIASLMTSLAVLIVQNTSAWVWTQ